MRNTIKKKNNNNNNNLYLFLNNHLSIISNTLWLNHLGWRINWKENSYLGSTDSENAFCFWCDGANRRWFLSWRGMQNPHAGIFGIKSGTFQSFFLIFKGSSKPNPIQTIRQSSHFFLFRTTLFLWELRSWKLLSMRMQNIIPIKTLLITSETF